MSAASEPREALLGARRREMDFDARCMDAIYIPGMELPMALQPIGAPIGCEVQPFLYPTESILQWWVYIDRVYTAVDGDSLTLRLVSYVIISTYINLT